ncbi:calcium channel protein [Taxawa tesnikishii (nom. ined.)]|nr:calcium channel protein [Dothideales sp. JES 119]
MNKANDLFAFQKKPSVKVTTPTFVPQQLSLLRSFTAQTFDDIHGGSRLAQKKRLAYRAFLRHSFNRLDFLAVVSFWISFLIGVFGVESSRHVYVFRMLSCLRILRLLGITSGTSVSKVILRSLKRAAPILLNVAFLIGFFWLLFAIVGVQSFKSSLRRTCVYQNPDLTDPVGNYSTDMQFCGGYLSANGTAMPYLSADGRPSLTSHKGFLCPVDSVCIEGENPYNGTVSFDNLLQSLELVFVIMTSNTFSDLLYYLTDSDYLAAALFFAFGIVIMSLWLMNLLIAVITSSFQVIREESRTSAFTAKEEHDPEREPESEDEQPNPRVSTLKQYYEKTEWIWLAVITFGLIVQCFRSASMGPARLGFINASELGVTLILLFEIVFRFIADWRHFLDPNGTTWICFWLSSPQSVVLAVDITRDLILTVLGNFSGLSNLILFVFLLTFLAAIFASQLFRGQIPMQDGNGDPINVNFSTIWNSFLGMYQILSSENWTTIMYNVTNYDVFFNTAWIGAAFFIIWFILANFVVLNMFIAVIQENFDVSEDEKRLQQVKAFLQQKRFGHSGAGALSLSTIFKFGQVRRQDPLDFGSAATEMLLKDAVVRDFLDDEGDAEDIESPTPAGPPPRPTMRVVRAGIVANLWRRFVERVLNRESNPFYSELPLSRAYEELDPRQMAREVVSAAERRKVAQREYLKKHPNYNVSLFIFKPDNPIRKFCMRIVGPGRGGDRIQGVQPSIPIWYAFSAFIYAAIVAMFTVKNWFVFTDMGFAALFTLEAIIKVIADGFFWTPNAYFRGSWGFIDGIVLVTLWVNVFTSLYNPGGGSRAVGALKALRALRLLNVSDSARDTFHSIIVMGGWKVISAALVSLSLLIPFAIYGLNLFNGQLQQCNDGNSNIYNLTDCVGEYLSQPYGWDVLAPRQVANSYYDFDNFGGSLFILFQIVSQEGWIDVMWAANSITGTFTQPSAYASVGNAVFFVIFNLLGAVFVLTLFVSVFMRNYTEQTGVAFLTADQRAWLELRKLLRQISPSKRPSSKKQRDSWKEWCYRRAVTKNGRWQRAVTMALVFHLILLCIEFYPDVYGWSRTRDYIFLALTFFYVANIAVRIIGLSWARFRRNAWDIYSLLSISGTFATTALLLSSFKERDYVQLHKLFLVSVVLLLIPRNNHLDQLFKTAAASLTSIANLLATWFVLFLVFAIALTQTFGLTRFNSNESGNVNFRTVPKALILLFRTSVGEGWNQIMEDFATVVTPTVL